MQSARRRMAATIASLLLLAAPAARALELHGVRVDDRAEAGGTALALNGAGTRYFVFFKVYVAALYLPHKTTEAAAALAMPGPKLLRLVMLREVSGKELGDKLVEGIHDNVPPAEVAAIAPELARLGGLFARRKSLKEGDAVTLEYVPGRGTTIDIDGVAADAPYARPQFFDALLRIWLGKDPADSRLKRALLGDAKAAQ